MKWLILVITHTSPRLRELGLLDEGARQILRGVYPECNEWAQDDKLPGCHPERSEGSRVDFWVIPLRRFTNLL